MFRWWRWKKNGPGFRLHMNCTYETISLSGFQLGSDKLVPPLDLEDDKATGPQEHL